MTERAGKRILIVDDEPFIMETVKFALEEAGYACLTAGDGAEAIERVHEDPPDLVLLDIMLPKVNGYQVCRTLKLDERYRGIPVFMLTARAQERDRVLAAETGADEYVTKPFEMADLLALVARRLAAAPASP
jgi:two-component system alkaline phosphatase synthesis response regulator PhoP